MPVLQMGTLRVRKVPSLTYSYTAYWPPNPVLGHCTPLLLALQLRDLRSRPTSAPNHLCDLGGATSL